ncbi:MAG: zf-HC2 domain-containing protein [Elusimicrobia bacterium]|nr:zf-HC2 domain-containing protein [Elusimicrobiota bacterium]
MDCREAGRVLQELLDDVLPAKAAHFLREHLASCPGCARVFSGLTVVAQALSALPVYSLRPQTRARILAIWASHRRSEAGRMWTSAALLGFACCSLALALWGFYAGLTLTNGQTLLDLLLDPAQAEVALRLTLMNWTVAAAHWWSVAQSWLTPIVPGIEGGVLVTAALFTAMVSMFLVIELNNRLRSAPRLGEYL